MRRQQTAAFVVPHRINTNTRAFRKFEKRTPGEYQQHLQIRAACELLGKPEWPLAEIAAECGFADQSHFTRTFRRMAATTPLRFRQAVVPKTAVA